MKASKTKHLFTGLLLASCFMARADVLSDTLRLRPLIKKKKPYPYQPLILKTSPTGFLYGGVFPITSEYRFSAEITTGRTQSDQVSVSYLSKNIIWGLIDLSSNTAQQRTIKASGYRLQYTHKFYLVNHRHHSPFGFYVGPHVSYADARVFLGMSRYYRDAYFDFKHFNADMIIGVQVGKPGRVTLDLCTGMGYKSNEIWYHPTSYRIQRYDSTDFGPYFNNHFHMLFDVAMGYAF
jgi:hypothetical protein